ncbi:MAG: DUF4340 domain-containing protein [Saccharofermentanales bacterium]
MKQWRKIIIFASTLVVLIILLIIGTKLNRSDTVNSDVTPTPGLDPVVDVAEEDVAGIKIENTSGILELKASTVQNSSSTSGSFGSTAASSGSDIITIEWSLIKPENVPFSTDTLKSNAAYFLLISASAEVAQSTDDMAEYGLDKPSAKVVITMKSGKAITVLYGDKTVGDSAYYVMVEGSSRICTASLSNGNAAMLGVLDVMDTKIYGSLVSADLTSIKYLRKKDSLDFAAVSNMDSDAEAGTEATWKITSPIEVNASLDGYTNFLKEVLAISPQKYVALNPDAISDYGLDNPDYSITLATADSSISLLIGGDAGGGARYGYTDFIDAVFVIDASSFAYIDKPVTELMDPFIHMVSIWELSRIDLAFGTETVVCGVEDYQDKSEDSNFTVNGKDANVINKSDDSYFRNFYQSLISIYIKGIDNKVLPDTSMDITIKYTLKEDGSVVSFAFAPRDEFTYYVFKDGKYRGFYVDKDDFYSEESGNEGVIPAYRILVKAIENQVDGVYQ